jgi:hypothetical protein
MDTDDLLQYFAAREVILMLTWKVGWMSIESDVQSSVICNLQTPKSPKILCSRHFLLRALDLEPEEWSQFELSQCGERTSVLAWLTASSTVERRICHLPQRWAAQAWEPLYYRYQLVGSEKPRDLLHGAVASIFAIYATHGGTHSPSPFIRSVHPKNAGLRASDRARGSSCISGRTEH